MSTTTIRLPLATADSVAAQVLELLESHCERIDIDLLAKTSARRPDLPILVIDEVSPPQFLVPGPTPRFAQLSCLRRQQSR